MFTNLNLTDMETCYKAIRGEVARSLVLTSDRFGFEPEVTARLAQAKTRIYEVPISLFRANLRRGKEDRVEGWRRGVLAHRAIQRVRSVTRIALCMRWLRAYSTMRPPFGARGVGEATRCRVRDGAV